MPAQVPVPSACENCRTPLDPIWARCPMCGTRAPRFIVKRDYNAGLPWWRKGIPATMDVRLAYAIGIGVGAFLYWMISSMIAAGIW